MRKRMSDLIDAYRDAVSQRVAFNSPEHHAAETAAREALLDGEGYNHGRRAAIEECAKIVDQFGEFDGPESVKMLRSMCATAIAAKLRSLVGILPND